MAGAVLAAVTTIRVADAANASTTPTVAKTVTSYVTLYGWVDN